MGMKRDQKPVFSCHICHVEFVTQLQIRCLLIELLVIPLFFREIKHFNYSICLQLGK